MDRRSKELDDSSPAPAAVSFTFGDLDIIRRNLSDSTGSVPVSQAKSLSSETTGAGDIMFHGPGVDAHNLAATVSQAVAEYLEDHLGSILLSLRDGQESIRSGLEQLSLAVRAVNKHPTDTALVSSGGGNYISVLSKFSESHRKEYDSPGQQPSSRRLQQEQRPPSAPAMHRKDQPARVQDGSRQSMVVDFLREFHSTTEAKQVSESGLVDSLTSVFPTAAVRSFLPSTSTTSGKGVNVYDLDRLRTDMVFLTHGLSETPQKPLPKGLSSSPPASCRPSHYDEPKRSSSSTRHLRSQSHTPGSDIWQAPAGNCDSSEGREVEPATTDPRNSDEDAEPGLHPFAVCAMRSDASSVTADSEASGPQHRLRQSQADSPQSNEGSIIFATSDLVCQAIHRTDESSISEEPSPHYSSQTPLRSCSYPGSPEEDPFALGSDRKAPLAHVASGRQVSWEPSAASVGASVAPKTTSSSGPTVAATSSRRTVDCLRHQQEVKILSANVDAAESAGTQPCEECPRPRPRVRPQRLLQVAGVVPFSKGRGALWYCWAAVFLTFVALGHSLVMAVVQPKLLYFHLVTACYCLGSFIGLIQLRSWEVEKLLGPLGKPIQAYAKANGFNDVWVDVSFRRLLVCLGFWLLTVGCRIASAFLPTCSGPGRLGWSDSTTYDPTSLAVFILSTGWFTVLMYMQLHVCCGLELAVDSFCVRFIQQMGYEQAVVQWSVVQALLRHAAGTIDSCFLAQTTCVLATLLLTGVSVMFQSEDMDQLLSGAEIRCNALWAGWLLAPVVLLLYGVFRAAAVSEKCSRVPAFVSSWALEDFPIDLGRQYASQHIMNSGAGFYVKGVRLSGTMALKLAYLIGVLFFTFVTKAVFEV